MVNFLYFDRAYNLFKSSFLSLFSFILLINLVASSESEILVVLTRESLNPPSLYTIFVMLLLFCFMMMSTSSSYSSTLFVKHTVLQVCFIVLSSLDNVLLIFSVFTIVALNFSACDIRWLCIILFSVKNSSCFPPLCI